MTSLLKTISSLQLFHKCLKRRYDIYCQFITNNSFCTNECNVSTRKDIKQDIKSKIKVDRHRNSRKN